MLLTLTTTHRPATDLGYLLGKNPARPQRFDLGFGTAHVFYAEADEDVCTAALLLDVDPVGLVRGRGKGEGSLDQYVNDRPYTASSFLSVALSRVLRSGMSGSSRERPELAETPIPLVARIAVLPFDNLSGDRDQDYFADGVVEDIITALRARTRYVATARSVPVRGFQPVYGG